MIMVDELRAYAQPPKAGTERFFGYGKQSCHLMTDGPVEELHAFADSIGLRREWFQAQSSPHYDLTPRQRVQALNAGAVFIPGRVQAQARIDKRQQERGR